MVIENPSNNKKNQPRVQNSLSFFIHNYQIQYVFFHYHLCFIPFIVIFIMLLSLSPYTVGLS